MKKKWKEMTAKERWCALADGINKYMSTVVKVVAVLLVAVILITSACTLQADAAGVNGESGLPEEYFYDVKEISDDEARGTITKAVVSYSVVASTVAKNAEKIVANGVVARFNAVIVRLYDPMNGSHYRWIVADNFTITAVPNGGMYFDFGEGEQAHHVSLGYHQDKQKYGFIYDSWDWFDGMQVFAFDCSWITAAHLPLTQEIGMDFGSPMESNLGFQSGQQRAKLDIYSWWYTTYHEGGFYEPINILEVLSMDFAGIAGRIYEESRKKGYDVGYDTGYLYGETDGYQDGYAVAAYEWQASKNGLLDYVSAVFTAPSYLINTIFDFDLFGFNVANVVKVLLTLIVIGFVIRFFMKRGA